MSGGRGLTIALATLATIVAVVMLLLIPVSLTLGRYLNVFLETVVLVACTGYVARVMRADRRRRRDAEATLPPERRPERRVPRRPITFQFRETLIAFLVWFVLVLGFNSLVMQLGPVPNVGIAVFAAFMLATLTVTGRHMMFRLTAEEETPSER
jgi:membrane protein implicated in regulation of membrane protease activity